MIEYKKHKYASIHDRDLIKAIYEANECCYTCIEFREIPRDLVRDKEIWGFCPEQDSWVRDDGEVCDCYESTGEIQDIVKEELTSLAGSYRAESIGDMMREEGR